MKKAMLTIGCGLGVIAGALLIWFCIVPAIGFVMEQITGFLPALLG